VELEQEEVMTTARNVITSLTGADADELDAAADAIMRDDGDRDHMNRSNLTCEMTQSIARFLRALAREARAKERKP
jgi:hypothetical protein